MFKSRTLRHVFVCQALLLLMASHAMAQTLDWRYAGGDGDGHALLGTSLVDLMSNVQLARFAGGDGDGHALLSPNPMDLSSNGQLARFGGGSGDGHVLLETAPLDLSNNGQLARFGGGNGDGYAMGTRIASDFANNAQDAKFAGGGDDGHGLLASAPRDLSNGDQLAWMRGGDGDGHATAVAGPGDLGGRTQLARFAGGNEDGHALLASASSDLANRGQLAKTIGGDGDGSALLAAAPMDLAGFPQLAKFAGGVGDGHGSDAYQPNTGNVPAVQVAAFLQGPFVSGAMTTALNTGNWIPLAQPYNTTPWNYIGPDSVLSLPSASIVDWVLLELRSGTAANTLAEQRAAFLKSDGRIVATDGISEVTFPHTGAGYYYLVLKHRNHLAVMSDTTYYFGALNAPVIDFRSSAAAAFGTNAMKTLTGGYFGLFAGDGTANGAITISDRNAAWRPQNGTNGYLRGDFNLSGGVTITDRNTYWRPNNGISTAVP